MKRRMARYTVSKPQWVSFAAIDALYERAVALTMLTGIKHEVDHIVPLAGEHVSGLTVPWNLRVVPHTVNALKGTKILEEGVAP